MHNPHTTAEIIKQRFPNFKPSMAIVLGSGLSRVAEQISKPTIISYNDLPGFPSVSVHGHEGQLVLGRLGSRNVVCLQGRSHSYENLSYDSVKTYVRTLKLLGCEIYLATNASGSLRREIVPGSLALVNDHINFQPGNPLAGYNDAEFGPRFLPMDNFYDAELRKQLHDCGRELDFELPEAVYISVLGPNYETPAEIRAFQTWGADLVGMSTVPEVLVARHCGMRVAVVSTVTNYATGISSESHDHDTVVHMANIAADRLAQLILKFTQQSI